MKNNVPIHFSNELLGGYLPTAEEFQVIQPFLDQKLHHPTTNS